MLPEQFAGIHGQLGVHPILEAIMSGTDLDRRRAQIHTFVATSSDQNLAAAVKNAYGPLFGTTKILVIDELREWTISTGRVLGQYFGEDTVSAVPLDPTYENLPDDLNPYGLVIFGAAIVGDKEVALARRLKTAGKSVLFFKLNIAGSEMIDMFSRGQATDVASKPYDRQGLMEDVIESLAVISVERKINSNPLGKPIPET